MADLLFRPAGELATLVHTGQVSSTELVTAALERIEQLQPSLNAFVHIDAEGACRGEAIDRDDPRPFAGVPIAIKDTTAVAGMPYTMGSDIFGDFVPGHDSHVTRRIRDAGFVIVGKTNMPEFGILPVTESRRYGPARNPWDTDRTPGGSSGGAAAAVAAGMVPLAHGSDGGGSIRIPASCSGLVGLKPTRGRISRGPDLGDDFLVQDGVLTRTVAETASMLDVLSGYEIGDTTWAPPPPEPFAEAVGREPGRLRIGYTRKPRSTPSSTRTASRPFRTRRSCSPSWATRWRRSTAPWGEPGPPPDLLMAFGTPIAMGLYFGGMVTGREPTAELVEPLSWTMWEGIRARSALDYLLARTQLSAISRGIIALWETLRRGAHARARGAAGADRRDRRLQRRALGGLPPLRPVHALHGDLQRHRPARDLGAPLPRRRRPPDRGAAGRPPGGRGDAPSLAAQLEAARPWADRRPELAAA